MPKSAQMEESSIHQEIRRNFTKDKPTRTWHAFQAYKVKDDQECNHVGMDGGRYFIPKETVIATNLYLRQRAIFYSSLVPQIRDNTILFLDVDHLGEDSFQKLMSLLIGYISEM